MKKFLSALLAAVLLLSATACAAHEPVLPPSRWGEGEAKGMLPHTYSLSEAYDAAEVVALVTVGDWLEEELITGRTFFRTTVQKVYKGDIPHEFVLAQEGCSTWTYRNYPVFTYGNQLLLFLIKYDVSMYRDTYDLVEYPDAYELINTYSTVMYVTRLLYTSAIRRVVNHPALRGLPMVLETPNDLPGYAAEIRLLRQLAEEG